MRPFSIVPLLVCLVECFCSTEKVCAQWVQTNGPPGGFLESLVTDGVNLFAGTNNSGVYRSGNDGADWTPVNSGLPPNCTVYALVFSGSHLFAGTFSGTSSGVYLSTNNGTDWIKANGGLPVYDPIVSFAVSTEQAGDTVLFAGTDGSGAYRSTTNGTSWTAINNGFPSGTSVLSFAVMGINLFAGTNVGVYVSTNNGSIWTGFSNGLADSSVLSLAASPKGATVTSLFAGTFGGGVFVSSNGGANWTNAYAGLENRIVFSLVATKEWITGINLFAATDSGIYRDEQAGIRSLMGAALAVSRAM